MVRHNGLKGIDFKTPTGPETKKMLEENGIESPRGGQLLENHKSSSFSVIEEQRFNKFIKTAEKYLGIMNNYIDGKITPSAVMMDRISEFIERNTKYANTIIKGNDAFANMYKDNLKTIKIKLASAQVSLEKHQVEMQKRKDARADNYKIASRELNAGKNKEHAKREREYREKVRRNLRLAKPGYTI